MMLKATIAEGQEKMPEAEKEPEAEQEEEEKEEEEEGGLTPEKKIEHHDILMKEK